MAGVTETKQTGAPAAGAWTGPEVRGMVGALFRLAWPSLVENLLQTALGVVSMIFVARLGASAVAAVGLSNTILNVLIVAFSGLAVGNTALVARNVGAGAPDAAARVARQALLMAAASGLAIGLVALVGADWAMRAIGVEGEVAQLGAAYLRVVGGGVVFMALMLVGGGTLRGAGDTVTPMTATLAMNAVNAVLAFVLIFGHFGLPALGVVGAAWAAVAARLVGSALILYRLVHGGRAPALGWSRAWRPDLGVARRIAHIGGPAALEAVLVNVGFFSFSLIAVHVGTVAFATQQIVFNAAQVSQLPGMAFSVAATTLVGQNLGAGNPRRAAMAGWLAVYSALAWMSALGLGYALFAGPILRLYTSEPEILATGRQVMWILAVGQPIQSFPYVLAGALRGAGDTRATMWGGIVGMWVFRIPPAWLCGVTLGLGLPGVWVGWLLDWILRGVVYTARFKSGRWQRAIH